MIEEQLEAAAELSPEELQFATLWLNRSENGLAAWQCVAKAYKGHDPNNINSCSTTAARLIHHNDRVRRYIEVMNADALQKASYSHAKLARMFMRQATTSEEKLDSIVEWRYAKDDKGKMQRYAWVPDESHITPEIVEIVVGYEDAPGGGIYLYYKELVNEAVRQKSGELLGKMAGAFIERVEHSGLVATYDIDATDPVKASQDYSTLIKGSK